MSLAPSRTTALFRGSCHLCRASTSQQALYSSYLTRPTTVKRQERREAAPHAAWTAASSNLPSRTLRQLTTSRPNRLPSDDPGGKPNDGSHPTVYDDFKNITSSDDPQLSVHSMADSSFTLSDGLVIHTPIILLNKQILLWDAPELRSTAEKPVMPNGIGWEAWTDDVWSVFEVVSPRPEIVVFGTGKTVFPIPPKIKRYLNRLGIQVEAHDTRNACSTYNLLTEEDRLVAAALLPDERKPTKRVQSSQAS